MYAKYPYKNKSALFLSVHLFDLILRTTVYGRVGKGGFTPSLSSRVLGIRDSLPSYGSSNLIYKYKLILFQVGKLYFKLASPFAPLPLQGLHHYYGLVCPCMALRYSAFGLFPLCISLCIAIQVPEFRN